MIRRTLALALAAALAATPAGAVLAPTQAGEGSAAQLAPQTRALLLLRVLAYDRNLKSRAGQAATVAILVRAGDRESEARGLALHQAFEEVARHVAVRELPVRAEVVFHRDAAGLDAKLEGLHPALVHVDEALASSVAAVVAVTRRRAALSAAGSRAMVEAGVALGVVPRGERAGVIVNLAEAHEEGADLEAGLLAVSEIVR